MKKDAEKKVVKENECTKFEDEYDIISVKPIGWEVTLEEKDTGEIYDYGQFETREEAETAFKDQLKEEKENLQEAEEEVKEEEPDSKE